MALFFTHPVLTTGKKNIRFDDDKGKKRKLADDNLVDRRP